MIVDGTGQELSPLRKRKQKLGIQHHVIFAGPKRGAELAEILNRHQILVVPSRYDEPFGVVALEGIACGCVVVGSSGGGVPPGLGRCGGGSFNPWTAALTMAPGSELHATYGS